MKGVPNMENILNFLQNSWYWILIAVAALILVLKFFPRYRIAPPDTAMIISGLIRRNYKVRNSDGTVSTKKFGYRIVRGGATFVIPAIERIDKLDMCLTQVDIRTAQPVPTKEYISVLVDAVANIKIGSDDLSIATAAEQLLHYNPEQIKSLAKDVLEGNMREIIGQMTIAELVQNRDKFAQESIKAAMSDDHQPDHPELLRQGRERHRYDGCPECGREGTGQACCGSRGGKGIQIR